MQLCEYPNNQWMVHSGELYGIWIISGGKINECLMWKIRRQRKYDCSIKREALQMSWCTSFQMVMKIHTPLKNKMGSCRTLCLVKALFYITVTFSFYIKKSPLYTLVTSDSKSSQMSCLSTFLCQAMFLLFPKVFSGGLFKQTCLPQITRELSVPAVTACPTL